MGEFVVRRQWKRDGSENWMDLDTAVENLLSSQHVPTGKTPRSKRSIRERLIDGEMIETKHARFSMEGAYAR